jgi:hypothetical protein
LAREGLEIIQDEKHFHVDSDVTEIKTTIKQDDWSTQTDDVRIRVSELVDFLQHQNYYHLLAEPEAVEDEEKSVERSDFGYEELIGAASTLTNHHSETVCDENNDHHQWQASWDQQVQTNWPNAQTGSTRRSEAGEVNCGGNNPKNLNASGYACDMKCKCEQIPKKMTPIEKKATAKATGGRGRSMMTEEKAE